MKSVSLKSTYQCVSMLLLAVCIMACSRSTGSVATSDYLGTSQPAVRIERDKTGRTVREQWFTKDGTAFSDLEFWEGFPYNGDAIVTVDGLDDFLIVSYSFGERTGYRLLENADVLQHRKQLKTVGDGVAYAEITVTMKDVDAMPFPDEIIREAVKRTVDKSTGKE
jgi:hypothetical protein